MLEALRTLLALTTLPVAAPHPNLLPVECRASGRRDETAAPLVPEWLIPDHVTSTNLPFDGSAAQPIPTVTRAPAL